MGAPVVTIDPLFADPDGVDRLVDLAHRYGRYRLYAEHERIDLEVGRGLHQRHDSVQHFVRTGGARGHAADPAIAVARTAYFREEYGYGDQVYAPGIERQRLT